MEGNVCWLICSLEAFIDCYLPFLSPKSQVFVTKLFEATINDHF